MKKTMTENYKQCDLRNKDGRTHVAWIPSLLARNGKELRILFGTTWSRGWIVREVYDIIRTREELDLQRKTTKDFEYALGD